MQSIGQRLAFEGEVEHVATQARDRGPERSRREALRRYEVSTAPLIREAAGVIECRKGCSFCCHLRVTASAVEILGLISYLENSLAPADFETFKARVADAAKHVSSISHEQHLFSNVRCPVLGPEGTCQAYPARPMRCRGHHSLSVQRCADSFANPADNSDSIPLYAELKLQADLMVSAFEYGQGVAGFDPTPYELISGMAEALADPRCRERLDQSDKVFATARFG